MKTLSMILTVILLVWSTTASAEYCGARNSGELTICKLTVTSGNDVTVTFSYAKQGWLMMITLYSREFVMLDGDARIKTGDEEMHTAEYIKTQRDIAGSHMVIEAGMYKVSEQLLHDLEEARGSVRMWLSTSEGDDHELKIWSGRFSKLDEFTRETRTTLGLERQAGVE